MDIAFCLGSDAVLFACARHHNVDNEASPLEVRCYGLGDGCARCASNNYDMSVPSTLSAVTGWWAALLARTNDFLFRASERALRSSFLGVALLLLVVQECSRAKEGAKGYRNGSVPVDPAPSRSKIAKRRRDSSWDPRWRRSLDDRSDRIRDPS